MQALIFVPKNSISKSAILYSNARTHGLITQCGSQVFKHDLGDTHASTTNEPWTSQSLPDLPHRCETKMEQNKHVVDL